MFDKGIVRRECAGNSTRVSDDDDLTFNFAAKRNENYRRRSFAVRECKKTF